MLLYMYVSNDLQYSISFKMCSDYKQTFLYYNFSEKRGVHVVFTLLMLINKASSKTDALALNIGHGSLRIKRTAHVSKSYRTYSVIPM